MGSIFASQPSELMGNITCITDPSKKILGYVETLKNISQKRVFVSREQITRPWNPIMQDPCPVYERVTDKSYYALYHRPIAMAPAGGPYPDEDGTIYTDWSLRSCLDCTYYGTKDKPDFWINDHK